MERFTYFDGETSLTGLLARPAVAPHAAVVIFPTIANHSAFMEAQARKLADEGYLAMIADLYGVPQPPEDQWYALMDGLRESTDGFRSRANAALEALRARPEAAALRLAAIGYCLGGQTVLELARSGADFAAGVSFHGNFQTGRPASAQTPIKARLLICHGDADPLAPRDTVIGLWEELDAAEAAWHYHGYSRVKHNFTDPESDKRGLDAVAYNASAARQSWAAMLALFDEIFA